MNELYLMDERARVFTSGPIESIQSKPSVPLVWSGGERLER